MKINRRILWILALSALLAATMLAGCAALRPLAAQEAVPTSPTAAPTATDAQAADEGGITVSAEGSIWVAPDVATFTVGVQTIGDTASAARSSNAKKMDKVFAALKAKGVEGAAITTADYSIYPTYDTKGIKITGYTVNNNLSVKVRDLDTAGDVLGAATAAGANWAGGISFDVDDRTAAYNEALSQAMEHAKVRAATMAQAAGVTLGQATTISESSGSSGPIYRAESLTGAAADTATVPVSSGQLKVTATITVVFQIAR